jgi:hypothetical protein
MPNHGAMVSWNSETGPPNEVLRRVPADICFVVTHVMTVVLEPVVLVRGDLGARQLLDHLLDGLYPLQSSRPVAFGCQAELADAVDDDNATTMIERTTPRPRVLCRITPPSRTRPNALVRRVAASGGAAGSPAPGDLTSSPVGRRGFSTALRGAERVIVAESA